MVCNFEMTEEQLRLALAAVDKAKSKGFRHTTAIFMISSVNSGGRDVFASFEGGVILRDHPSDPSKNWGNTRADHIDWYQCVNGERVNDYSSD